MYSFVIYLRYFQPYSSHVHREVVLGEHKVGDDPDCWKNNNLEEYCQPPVQRFGVEEVVSHPNWNAAGNGYRKGYDIALVRLDRKATLYLVCFLKKSIRLHRPISIRSLSVNHTLS